MFRTILLALLFIAAPAAAKVDPKAVEELIAADRAFDQAGKAADPVAGISRCLTTSSCPRPRAMPSAAMPLSPCSAKTRPTRRARPLVPNPRRHFRRRNAGLHLRIPVADERRPEAARPQVSSILDQAARGLARRRLSPAGPSARRGVETDAAPTLPPFAAEPVTDPAAMTILHLSVAAAEVLFRPCKRSA